MSTKNSLPIYKKAVRIGSSIVSNHLTSKEKFLTVNLSGGDIALFNSDTGRKVVSRELKKDSTGTYYFTYQKIRYNMALDWK